MKHAMIAVLLAAPVGLAGCATPAVMEPTGPCRVDDAVTRRFVATEFRAAMRDELQAVTNSRVVRVLRPGDVTTKEFREDRLNVEVDEGRKVNRLYCG